MSYRNTTLDNSVSKSWYKSVLSTGTALVWLWISWTNGTIAIGRGNVTGLNLMLYYPENFLIANLSTVAVSSYASVTADWKIPYNQSEGKMHCGMCLMVKDNLFVPAVYNT